MTEDKYANKLLGHECDGIQEYDNPLPAWWTWLSIITVLIAVVYLPYMHAGLGGLSQDAELEREIAQAHEKWPSLAQPGGAQGGGAPKLAVIDESKYRGNLEAIAAGKQIFAIMCAPCHGPEAKGNIGPNLTDNEWIHGGKYNDLRRTITVGVPEKGMVTWGGILTDEQIAQVAAYEHSLGGGEPD